MNKLHHFGDSYANTGFNDVHFVKLLSKNNGYLYQGVNTIKAGSSNELMLNNLLYRIFEIEDGDMLFFNFSFFVRGCYYDFEKREVRSTNSFYCDGPNESRTISECNQYIRDIITYQLDCNEDYNRRLFHQIDTIFEQLHKRNIVVNYIFNEETPWCDDLLKYGNKIKFDGGFVKWLYSMDYHKEEECHYSRGVQELIYDKVIKQIVFPKKSTLSIL
jgi:hypothetical protein